MDIRNGLYVLRYTGPGAKTVRDIEFLEGSSNVVLFRWSGFLSTFKDAPFLNEAHADGIQRFWFRLGGDYGLDVLHGTPSSRRIDCTTFASLGPYEAAETPSWDGLSYQAHTGRYSFPWRTTSDYAGTCREFVLTLRDGSSHSAYPRVRQVALRSERPAGPGAPFKPGVAGGRPGGSAPSAR